MAYVNVYPTRINWENDPSINTPINEVNLNKMDYALYQHDQTLANWDTTKANQSDLLLCVKTIAYDTDTGVFVFTWQNGTTQTVDLNIEKIPVSFSMDANGVITMTTEDGTQYTADVGALIKTYTFTDSSVIDFTVTTDQSGNKTITADIVDGSITGTKLQPNYLADCTAAKTAAELAETGAEGSAEDAEAWAVGQRNGVDVPNTDPTYHNNSKYWASQANVTSLSALTDTDINAPTNNQVLGYDSTSQKWENMDAPSAGLLPYLYITTEADAMVTVKCSGIPDIYPTEVSTGHYECELPAYGLYTIHSDIEGDDATYSFNVDAVKEYNITVMHYIHTINVTVMSGASISVSGGGETLSGVGTGSAQAFVVHHASTTYTVTTTVDGVSAPSQTVNTPATSEQSTSLTFQYGTINLTYANEFRGLSLSCSSGGTTITKTAPATGNSMVFYPPSTGTWTITGVYSGVTYSSGSITVSSLSTPVSAILQTVPDGRTVTPTDNIQKWLKCAGINDKSYTTLAEVLADSTTLLALLSDNNANDYLVRSKSWTTANGLVPTMTSATQPSGVVDASAEWTVQNFNKWKAFNQNETNGWLSDSVAPYVHVDDWVSYEFTSSIKVALAKVTWLYQNQSATVSGKIQAYDGANWVDVSSVVQIISNAQNTPTDINVTVGNNTYTKYRWICTTQPSSNYGYGLKLQFYATTENAGLCDNSTAMTDIGANNYCANTLLADSTWCSAICNSTYFESVLNVKVPTMTSNTTPSGVASASDTYSESLAAWKAFDGIDEGNNDAGWLGNGSSGYLQYEFASPIKPYCFAVRPYHYSGKCRTKKFQMQGASGGSFSDISAVQTLANGTTSATVVKFLATNNSSFKQFRLNITESQDSYTGCNMLQIYGR